MLNYGNENECENRFKKLKLENEMQKKKKKNWRRELKKIYAEIRKRPYSMPTYI